MWKAVADSIKGKVGYTKNHLEIIKGSWPKQKKAALKSLDSLEEVLNDPIHEVQPKMREHLLDNLRMYYNNPFHHLEKTYYKK